MWEEPPTVPYATAGMFAVSNGTSVYVGGGGGISGDYHDDLWRYDLDSNSWTPLGAVP